MDKLDKHFFQPKKFKDIIDTAKIVIDTNVLLAAYQYRDITFNELINTLESLNQQERLIIPSHVLKEFFKNRPNQIVEIIQTVQQVKDSLPSIKEIKNIETKIPSLDYLSCNEEIQKAESDLGNSYKKYNENLKEYRKKLAELINELKSFFNSDPILEKYEEIFKNSYYNPDTLKDYEEMINDFNKRVKKNIPPGLKDAQKSENREGDYIIWEHILQIKNSDVIFISADNKPDWVYKEPNGNLINARRELVEEFYEKSIGKSFCIVHPSEFLKVSKPTINNEVIEDLNKLEENAKEADKAVLEYFANKSKVISTSLLQDEYGSSRLKRLLDVNMNNNVDSTEGYRKGTNYHMDKALRSIVDNTHFYFEVLTKADTIAKNRDLSNYEKDSLYKDLAHWVEMQVDEYLL